MHFSETCLFLCCKVIEVKMKGVGEGEVAVFSAKPWDRRDRADLIECATPCHDAQLMGSYLVSHPFRLTVPASKPEDCTIAPRGSTENIFLKTRCCFL